MHATLNGVSWLRLLRELEYWRRQRSKRSDYEYTTFDDQPKQLGYPLQLGACHIPTRGWGGSTGSWREKQSLSRAV